MLGSAFARPLSKQLQPPATGLIPSDTDLMFLSCLLCFCSGWHSPAGAAHGFGGRPRGQGPRHQCLRQHTGTERWGWGWGLLAICAQPGQTLKTGAPSWGAHLWAPNLPSSILRSRTCLRLRPLAHSLAHAAWPITGRGLRQVQVRPLALRGGLARGARRGGEPGLAASLVGCVLQCIHLTYLSTGLMPVALVGDWARPLTALGAAAAGWASRSLTSALSTYSPHPMPSLCRSAPSTPTCWCASTTAPPTP